MCINLPPLRSAIKRLRSLDLAKYPVKEIQTAFREFGKFGVVGITLHAGKSVIRARPNNNGYNFNSRSELSYKPQEFNHTYQRASTPNNTMFYGCVTPENIMDGEWNSYIPTALLEASAMCRNNIVKGEEKITFGRWVVLRDIPLVALVYHSDFVKNSHHTNELNEAYKQFLIGAGNKIAKNSLKLTEFLAAEFAKSTINGDYDYLISALFTETLFGHGFAGVYYPSVRADGKGFNVAIHTDFVDNAYMRLVAAGECTIYKNGKHFVVDNETDVIIANDEDAFRFNVINDPTIHTGREACINELNRIIAEANER